MAARFKPTIHSNGTSRDALMDDYQAFGDSLRAALRACERAIPNGRDYYPQGADASRGAIEEHGRRCRAIREMQVDVQEIIEHIADSE